ncbi:tRNA (adenine(58)-N(1))-methyltransferase non-catalytic subunit TRM6 [Trichogramma pretiosum]|uniref:tRNA (adenine(58)-N(1))-methyltransferase non-catalytic subunit TRM6 n=1 Tax=Trichogramma pretiosum TaxID=7493 RepID=UPI0006C9DCD5|nr:tRNA (adenine(58)-N(1))-methyltransferase non-catalytic subunit TRM6 [Trichogramma pretiosum]
MKELAGPNYTVTVGSHVIIQKLNFKKVYRVTETGSLALGREEIKMNAIIGKPYWSTFKIIEEDKQFKKAKRTVCYLELAEKSDSLHDLKNAIESGRDNRSINDDGKSQKLSKCDILELKDAGKSGREIVSSLIENNASFAEKTEYSQEKYIKKKEKKYCQFLSVHRPTLAALQEIYQRQDPQKIYHLRMDTLAQIFSYCNIQADGMYMLYDSGTAGLVPAGMLSRIGQNTSGNLIYLHSGDHLPQMPIIRAMNFPQEQSDRMTTVSIFDFLRTFGNNESKNPIVINDTIHENCSNGNNEVEMTETPILKSENKVESEQDKVNTENINDLKRKNEDNLSSEEPVLKKSKKILDLEQSMDLISKSKADSLVVIAKEHPLNIVTKLLPFVKSSRPFIIYHASREPLQETYIALKQNSSTINLRLFSSFLRSYQVLEERTHPEINTNNCGGYILTGYTIS